MNIFIQDQNYNFNMKPMTSLGTRKLKTMWIEYEEFYFFYIV